MADILTAEQQAAVENRGRSLLVSAAAGSGKTKVLVERLFSYVESGEANLDDFLIITYTRAAAAELRGKIAKVLGEKLQEDPLNAHLQRQLLRVYRADIKTVDAFCTALLRENCHLLREDARGHALRPDFRVLDENEAQLLRERVLARTLDEFYETMHDGDGASLLADTLGAGRDDRALGALVLELHGKAAGAAVHGPLARVAGAALARSAAARGGYGLRDAAAFYGAAQGAPLCRTAARRGGGDDVGRRDCG